MSLEHSPARQRHKKTDTNEPDHSLPSKLRPTVVRLPAVMALTGLSRSSVYAMVNSGRFPAPVKIGARAIGWYSRDIDSWLEARPPARRERLREKPRELVT